MALKVVTSQQGTTAEVDFVSDLGAEATRLLVEKGLTAPQHGHCEQLLYAYFNWAMRRIEPKPRRVLWSKRLALWKTKLPKAVRLGLERFVGRVKQGVDLTPHLSTRILKAANPDHLLCDWGIHHFHLDLPAPLGKPAVGFVNRGDELLFGIVGSDFLGLLDVRSHGSFADRQLLELLLESWPELLEPYQLRGFAAPRFPGNDDVTKVARAKHFNTVLTLSNGVSYVPPGGGLRTDGSASDARVRVDRLLAEAIDAENRVVAEADAIRTRIRETRGVDLPTLKPKLRFDGKGLAVEEPQASCRITFTDD